MAGGNSSLEPIGEDHLSEPSARASLHRVPSCTNLQALGKSYDSDDDSPERSITPTPSNPTRIAKMTATTPARSGVSPSSSPRLPSPPPFTEVQFGPKSPTIGDGGTEFQLGDTTKPDEGAARRIRPGTKAADMASGPPLVPLNLLDSPFQLQEHLKALYFHHTKSADGSYTLPITKETAMILAKAPETGDGEQVDKNLWLYELCRFLTKEVNVMVVAFFGDHPPCSAETCPEMRASEWQYLCAVHDPPKSCAAIDYCCHTLDWAANILTSPKHFPSRLTLGGDGTNTAQSMRHLVNIFRREYRIFAHAWFQHLDVFWEVEAKYGLYIFFKTVCDLYSLIPEDNYTIPAEAEGAREDQEETPVTGETPDLSSKMTILSKSSEEQRRSPERLGQSIAHGESATTTLSVGATTRRHKHTPSTGSHVATIAEGAEEEESAMDTETPDGTRPITIIGPNTPPETQSTNMPTEADLASGLGRLDLSSTALPAFDERAPQDPTPTPHDIDPLAAAGSLDSPPEQSKEDVLNQILGHTEGSGEEVTGGEGEEEEIEERPETTARKVEEEPDKDAKDEEKDVEKDEKESAVEGDDEDEGIGEPIEIPTIALKSPGSS